jgi:hypothetical protein
MMSGVWFSGETVLLGGMMEYVYAIVWHYDLVDRDTCQFAAPCGNAVARSL